MGKFDSVLDDVYGKEDKKITSVLDEVYGPKVEPITMVENEPTPIADMMVGLNRGIESMGEAIAAPVQRLFTAPSNQDVVVPEELDLGSMQSVRDRQAMILPKAPVEPGYVPPAGIAEGLEAALPIAYQGTKKGIAGAVQALAENAPVTSFPTAPIAEYMQGVGEGAQAEIEKTIQEKQIRPGTAGAFTTDVASSMAQFLPIAGMSIIAPSVAPAGLAFLATVSGGDKYQKAKEAGFGEGEALAQGIAYGAAEAIGEKIGLDYLLAAAKNPAVMSGVKTIFAQGLKQAGVEGAEEGLTQIIQNATDIVAKKARPETKGEAPGILQDVPYAMGVGAAAGGVTGGGLGALQSMLGQQQAPQTEAPKKEVKPEEPIRESPTATEPPPQNMEATTEFLTRKPAVTFGEAERLKGEEIPTSGMTIGPRRPAVTFGGEGERTGEAIPEGAGMTIQPTAPSNKLDQLFKREPSAPQPKKEYGYLMNARPFSIGAQPKGQVRVNERTDGRYGTIYYDRPLTEQEMKSYELKPEGPIVYKDVTDNPFYNDIKDLKVIDTDKSADNILELTGSDKPIFLRNGKERIAVITPSAKQKGKFQATTFDERGPIGDAVSNTPKEAIKSLIEDGYKELSNEQEFTELTFDTKETQRQEVIRKINKPSTPSPQPQQATEVAPKDITPQPVLETQSKPPEIIINQKGEQYIIEPEIEYLKRRYTPVKTPNGATILMNDIELNQLKESPENYEKLHTQTPKPKQENVPEQQSRISSFEKIQNAYGMTGEEAIKQGYIIKEAHIGKNGKDVLDGYSASNGSTVYKSKEKALEAFVNNGGQFRQSAEPTPAKTPEIEPRPKSGPGMFGGATVQNMYGEITPKIKRGLDIFKKKAKEFIADEEGFYSPEELANAVKAVKDKFIGKIKRGQSTQVTNTINTYAKILDRIADKAQGKTGDVRIVDVSTGLGMSEELAKNLGYKKYETTEPFPAEGFVPTYKDSTQLPDNAFDFITNNQVLNVVPKNIRDGIVKDIGRALKEGGTAIISTRGKDVMAATTGRAGEEPMSLYIPAKDAQGKSYEQYQKGFTNAELKDYVQGLLGDGFDVKTAPFGAAGVEITKIAKPTKTSLFEGLNEPRPKSGPEVKPSSILLVDENGNITKPDAPYSRLEETESDARFKERFKEKGLDPNLTKISGPIKTLPAKILKKMSEGYDLGYNSIKRLIYNLNLEEKIEPHTQYFFGIPMKIEGNIIGKIKELLTGTDAQKQFEKIGDKDIIIVDNLPEKSSTHIQEDMHSKIAGWVEDNKGSSIFLYRPNIKNIGLRRLKEIITHEAQHLLQLQEGKTPDYNLNYKERPMEIEARDTGKQYKSGRLSMFGAGQLQNAYEKVEPALKKGADMLFKKGKQAYETVKRNADLTRDMGRVVDITEKEGRPVETEPPIRPRIGLFNLQNVYDAVFGKPKTSDDRITVGDPTIGKKINDMYDRTNKAEVKMKQEAESKRQTIGGAARQSLIDLFAPYLDIAKKDSATYEKALASLHDVFYIPSSVEAFLNNYRDQILSPIKKANKTYRDYSAYRMAKWTLTGRTKVKSPLSLKEAQDFVDSIDPQTRKLFEDITTDFHEKTWKPLLQEIEDSGLKDDKVIKFIMDKENYATFFPAKQMGLSYGSREYKPSGEIFKLTEEGFQGDIQDVLTSLMQKGIAMLTHANINMAKLTGIDILKTMSPKDITPAKQSFKGYRKVKDTNGNEIEMPIMEFDEPAPNSQMALLTVRENGKAKGYYVPKQFAEAFDNALGDPSSFADSLHYYSNLTQAIKNVWIDYNPPWQLFTNMVRDIPAAAIEMPGFKKPVKFLGKVIKKAPAAIGDYVKFVGEVGQQITGYDRKAFEKQVTQLLKEKKLLSSKDVQHLGDYNITVFDRIQNAFDTFPKEGESQGFLQQLKAFGKDVERLTKVAFDETLQESGEFTQDEIKNMTRRGGSPAFGARGGGKAFEAIKVPLMFYNAVKEGWRAGKYFYQKDPAGFLIKASVPLSIFSFGAAAAAGAFGDEWKKAYLAIKKSDRENKLVYPLWWTDEGNIKYLALSVPQFLKPFMIMINELASSNPSLAEGLADAMSNEMPSLNPVLDITKTLTSYGGNKPPIDRFGNPIMTQDQWTAGGSEKALALLKSISNQNLFGSLFKFPIKPTDPKKDFVTSLYDATFGKIMKESFAPAIDTEEQDANAAKARLLARQIIEIEKENPEEANRLRDEMRKLGYTPSRQFMRSVRRETNIEREKEAGTITDREAYEKRLRQQPKTKRKKYNELFKK